MEIGYFAGWHHGFVRDYFERLQHDGQRRKAEVRLRLDLLTLQEYWPNTLNVDVRLLRGYEPLWEMKRPYQGMAYRIFFCVQGQRLWLLHAIEKKSDKTEISDLVVAYRRMKDVFSGKVKAE